MQIDALEELDDIIRNVLVQDQLKMERELC